MIRAFVALALPEAVRFELMLLQQGLPLPRPVAAESLHLTLVFLGEVPAPVLGDVDLALAGLRGPALELRLSGAGLFGGAKPRVAYAGVAANPGLMTLQAKVERAVRGAGVEVQARRYTPHVTLGRLPERFDNRERLERAVAARAGPLGPAFAVTDFRLYRSHLTGGGPIYEELARYPLAAASPDQSAAVARA